MAIRITVLPEGIVKLKAGGPELIQALVQKMQVLMIKLQAKITGETIPRMFEHSSNIVATVRANPVTAEGAKIVGSVQAGGPRTTKITLKSGEEVDYAGVQEFGINHNYEIKPFNKRILSFIWEGKRVWFYRVNHPPLVPRPFMRLSMEEMSPEIVAGLQATLTEFFE